MKAVHTLIFLVSIMLLLVGLCLVFPENGVSIEGINLRFPDLEEVLTKKEKDKETAEEKLQKAEEELRFKIERDSLASVYEKGQKDSLAYVDTLNFYLNFNKKASARIVFPDDDPTMMNKLFTALDKCGSQGKVIHILHYGDSQIEADRITGYIREKLQNKFGGYGAGLVPIIQPIPSSSVMQYSSDSLPRYIADGTLRQKLKSDRYGVLAQMSQLKNKVTLNYAARDWNKSFSRTRKFSQIRLLLGNCSDNFKATLQYGDKDSTQKIVTSCPDMKVLTWQLDTMISNFKLHLSGNAELYGVSMDGKQGVAMDNIPMRGSSGTFFTKISPYLLTSSMEELNVKMILLEFGGNAMPNIISDKGVKNYKTMISRQIAYLKQIYPQALILLIGPADMSVKIDGELQTYPFLEENIEGMKEAALENGAAFWNMYEVMGGHNSMVKWVEHKPAWAGSDYIHFTPSGANRIAEVFVESFNTYYDFYHFKKRNKKWCKE